MVRFTATLKRFASQGEKTGWTYIEVPTELAQQVKPGQKQTFRVKGRIDQHSISGVALMPMGGGNFILTINAVIRKAIKKQKGATVEVQLEEDKAEIKPPAELIECLKDEPKALEYFNSLTKGHQNYFTKWIESAKTETTRAKRIADSVNALSKKMDFGLMLRSLKKDRQDLLN
jgi:hypothetical protein